VARKILYRVIETNEIYERKRTLEKKDPPLF
jgi:hypothetical protein